MNTTLSKHPRSFTAKEPATDNWLDPLDISDIWNSEVEPGDADVRVYFNLNFDHGQNNPTIVGFSYDDGHGPIFGTEKDARCLMGNELMMRLERAYSDEVNDA